MDLKKANKHFDKLVKFYENVRVDGEINRIESDLLKSYVLKFYEALSDVEQSSPKIASKATTSKIYHEPAPIVKKENGHAHVEFVTEPVKEIPAIVEEKIAVPTAVTTLEKPKVSQRSSGLFDFEIGKEISDKLSTTKIADISTSMSINERVSTMVDLFGGNKEAFEKTMKNLNDLGSYDEAKSYLTEHVVDKYNWSDGDKPKKVKNLMKLVYRRYV